MIKVGIFFIVLGILVRHAKLYFLLAGYNTMPKEEKEKYDIAGIATVFRNVMIIVGLIMIGGELLGNHFNNPMIEKGSMFIAIAIGIPALLIVSNSDKYKIENKEDHDN